VSIAGLAITFIGILSLFNLYLTLAVVRYLRRQDERLNPRAGQVKTVNSNLLKPGTQIPEFATVTVSGDARSLSGMTGAPSLIGFFSAHCTSCLRQAPEFRSYARASGYASAHVLAVIVSPRHEDADQLREELAHDMPIVMEPPRGTVCSAFSISSYPAIFALDEHGTVQASDIAVRNIAAARAARAGREPVHGDR
jgi:peroxiredoxin